MYSKLVKQLKNDQTIDCKMVYPRFPFQGNDSLNAFIVDSPEYDSTLYVVFDSNGRVLDHRKEAK